MPAGGRFTFRTATEGGRVVVRAEDGGCGMSEETRRRVFESMGELLRKPADRGAGWPDCHLPDRDGGGRADLPGEARGIRLGGLMTASGTGWSRERSSGMA